MSTTATATKPILRGRKQLLSFARGQLFLERQPATARRAALALQWLASRGSRGARRIQEEIYLHEDAQDLLQDDPSEDTCIIIMSLFPDSDLANEADRMFGNA